MKFEPSGARRQRDRKRSRVRVLPIVTALCVGCGPSRSSNVAGADGAPSPVELREVANHPRLSLVVRDGDPAIGLAFAFAHDGGAAESAALAGLLARRLEKSSLPIDFQPHGIGLVVRGLAKDAKAAAQFIAAVTAALARPVRSHEALRPTDSVTLVRPHEWASPAEAAVGSCSGDLGVESIREPSAADVEKWRQEAFATASTAFAAVGSESELDDVEDALDDTQDWPSGDEPNDDWPDDDVIGVGPARLSPSAVSAAIRVASAGRALAAAQALGTPRSALPARLRALEPAWTVDRVSAIARPRGACIRVDLHPDSSETVALERAAAAAELTLREMEAAYSRKPDSRFGLDTAIFSASDPRDAAAIAAWRSVSESKSPGDPRRFVRFSVPPDRATEEASEKFREAVSDAGKSWSRKSLDTIELVEPGQGEFWMLVATPCGTAAEGPADAGLQSLMVRSLIGKRPVRHGVKMEPWATPEGVGVLAHATRQNASETSLALAGRVAAALGQALAATRIRESDAALSRAVLQVELDPERAGLLTTAYAALAPEHPSWLDARGTWSSVTQQTMHAIELQRREFVRGPLRVAFLANDDDDQADAATRTLEYWLRPLRADQKKCAPAPPVTTRVGEYSIETSDAPDEGAHALVAVSFTPDPIRGIPREAEWTLMLLNRPGGWLDRALRRPRLVSRAVASLAGGPNAAALMIDISTMDANPAAAVAQVRALLGRLAAGAVTEREAALARRYFAEMDRRVALNPRYRLVEAWRAAPEPKEANLASLRRFHQVNLIEKRHVVVVEKPKSP